MARNRSTPGMVVTCTTCFLSVLAGACLLQVNACIFGDCRGPHVAVRGRVVSADARETVSDVLVGGRSFTNGEETDFISPLTVWGTPNSPSANEDGSFELAFGEVLAPCRGTEPFPVPDQVEIVVVRDICEQLLANRTTDLQACDSVRVQCPCEQRFLVDVDDQTGEFLEPNEHGDPVILLKDPIVVHPCEGCCAFLLLRGKVLDADTLVGLAGAAVRGISFTDGQETQRILAFPQAEGGLGVAEDGSFQVTFSKMVECAAQERFPRPDRVHVSVVREACRKGFPIDINEETAVFLDLSEGATPVDVIELNDPILVPPCGE